VGLFYTLIGIVVIVFGMQRASWVRPFPEKSLRGAQEDVRYISERATGH
jgi:hypothetical protein